MASSPCRLLPHRIHRTLTSSASILSSMDLPPSASQKLLHKTPDHISSVISLLRSFGVSGPHLAMLVDKRPRILACCIPPLESKLQFLYSFGFTYGRIGRILSSDPRLVRYSLPNRIAPNFHRLRPIFGDDIIGSICRTPRLLILNIEDNFLPNIKALKSLGMPDSIIKRLIRVKPRTLSLRPHEFEWLMLQVQAMGYDFSTESFVGAFAVLAYMSKSTLDRKLRLLQSLGWSAEEILTLFRIQPCCIVMPDDMMKRSMEFFLDTLHWTPAALVKHAQLLRFDLDQRIIRRCSVFNVLVSKGAIITKMPEVQLFLYSEPKFVERYVKKYQDKFPAVLDAYQGMLKLASPELECNIRPNVWTLKRYNVPKSVISSLVRKKSRALMVSSVHFDEVMEGLKRMSYQFTSKTFPDALDILGTMPNMISEEKFNFFSTLGWSEKEIIAAFKMEPSYVKVSDEKVRRIICFLEAHLNWGPTYVANFPSLLLLSLEKTIIPRYSILNLLMLEGRKRNIVVEPSLFLMTESRFFKLYVEKHRKKFPAITEICNACSGSLE